MITHANSCCFETCSKQHEARKKIINEYINITTGAIKSH